MKRMKPVYYLGLTKETSISDFLDFCKKELGDAESHYNKRIDEAFLLTTIAEEGDKIMTLGDVLDAEFAYVFVRVGGRVIHIFDVLASCRNIIYRSADEEDAKDVMNCLRNVEGINAINKIGYDGTTAEFSSPNMNIDFGYKVYVKNVDIDIVFETEGGKMVGETYKDVERKFLVFESDPASDK